MTIALAAMLALVALIEFIGIIGALVSPNKTPDERLGAFVFDGFIVATAIVAILTLL